MSAFISRSNIRRALLASTAFILPLAAQAQNATWNLAPGSNNWNTAANWTPATVPTNTAIFDLSAITALSFSANTSIATMQFNAGAPAYSFTTGPGIGRSLTINGTGVVNNSAFAPTFTNTGLGTTTFTNSATAANAIISNVGGGGGGSTRFLATSTAGTASIGNTNGGETVFGVAAGTDTSTAANATITTDATSFARFFAHSTAGNATINDAGGVEFRNQSTAANAHINPTATGVVTFFDSSSGGNAVIANSGSVNFLDNSTAANASITNNSGGRLGFGTFTFFPTTPNPCGVPNCFDSFQGTGSAGNAIIVNNNGGSTTFFNQSTAGTATITNNSGGSLLFSTADPTRADPDAATARVFNNAGGTVDISQVNHGVSIGSVEGAGGIFLGARQLTLGNTNLSATISGVIADGGTGGGTGGSLVHVGTGTLTLTGANTYTGPTTVSAGALIVNGSIVSASTVSPGGTLGGSGTVGPVSVAGGTLAPGSQASIGTLSINGPLSFSASSFYNVRITPTANDRTNVTGIATLGGATVNVAAGAGTYAPNTRYTILNATGGLNGSAFNPAVTTNLAFLMPTLTYDANNVFLTVVPTAPTPTGTPDFRIAAQTFNQFRVATGLTNAAALNPSGVGGTIVTALSNLAVGQAPAVFDALSGAGIAATQNLTFDSSKLFTSAMTDQGRYWREGGPDINGITAGGPATFYASTKAGPFDVAVAPPPPPPRTWRAWFTGFGEGQAVHSELPLGTARQDNGLYGGAGGLDYQLFPNTLIGVAAGGSSGRFSVPTLATSGTVDGGHIGAYGVTTLGAFYAQSSSTFSIFRNHETRNITPFGGLPGEIDRGDFGSTQMRSRLEIGRKFLWSDFAVTPFVAMEIAKLWSNAFTETGGILGLTTSARSQVSAPAFVGARFEKGFVLANGWVFTPSVSAAWVHEFSPVRDLFAGLTFLPASTFVVDGARPASNGAQVKAGAKLALNQWAAVYADFEGELSNKSQSYGGKGGLKVSW